MNSRRELPPHRWDSQLGELVISGRTVGYVYFRTFRGGVEWNARRWWRLSGVQDVWVETEEWYLRPDGEVAHYVGDNDGAEAAFAELDDGIYTADISRLDPTTAQGARAGDEVQLNLRWLEDSERNQLLADLRAR